MRVERLRGSAAVLAIAAVAAWAGCRSVSGQYTWVDAYQPRVQLPATGYVITPGDVLSVHVWNQEGMSTKTRVRDDGRISLPFVNDVEAAGLELPELARRLQTRLKEFVVNPVVSVALEESALLDISVLGEVMKPGVYRIERQASVLKALASAGGLTDTAGRDRIFVLRPGEFAGDPQKQLRIRFRYDALAHAEGEAARFRLQGGDVVVVE